MKRFIYVSFIFLCFFACFLLTRKVLCEKERIDRTIDKNKWALYNFGQDINGKRGIGGIDINVKNAWKQTEGNDNIIVAVLDTGIEIIDENKSIWKNSNETINGKDDDENGFIDDYYGWDFYNNDCSVYDDYIYDYHGTYIANIILDVAPKIQILPCKFLEGTVGDAKDSIKAAEYAIKNGAQIINCSWGFKQNEQKLYNIIKDNSDIVFVCAAGNAKLDLDEDKIYPASYDLDNVISVMSIDNSGELYEVSGYGSNVTIAAPGENIWVTLPEGDHTFIDGTSASTAYVSGAVALMKSVNKKMTPKKIKDILVSTAKKKDTLNDKCLADGYLDVSTAINACNN